MLGRQRRQLAVGATVELDEDQVPDLDDFGLAGVDEFATGFVGRPIVVNFGAGAAWAGVAHLPEVVLFVALVDVLRVDVGDGSPHFGRFVVGGEAFLGVALEDGRVQAVFFQAPDFGEQLPGPSDGFFFEVVAERPVAEHFEECVVVGVLADVVEIVVFAAGANALLRVGGALVGPRLGAEKIGLNWFMPALVNSTSDRRAAPRATTARRCGRAS